MPIPQNGAGIGVTMDWDFLDSISTSVQAFPA
jgi:O-succinylbenzoate synthase